MNGNGIGTGTSRSYASYAPKRVFCALIPILIFNSISVDSSPCSYSITSTVNLSDMLRRDPERLAPDG